MTKKTKSKTGTFNKKSGVYAGSFDPITKGHLEIIFEAAKLMDRLYVVVGINPHKQPLFSPDERVAMIEKDIKDVIAKRLKKAGIACDIKVKPYKGLTAHFMKAHNAPFYIRGLRMGTEFDAEHAAMVAGRKEYKDFTAVFLTLADNVLQATSSSLARELEMFNGQSIDQYVTPHVAKKLAKRVSERGLRVDP